MSVLSLSVLLESAAAIEINVFDFDDTLVKTKSKIYLVTQDGKHTSLTPAEFAMYESQPGDSFDFSDFQDVKQPTIMSHMLLKLKYAIRTLGSNNVFILTAREVALPIITFLEGVGISGIDVIALGNSDPLAKANNIKQQILARRIKLVRFYDDSIKNVAAVKALKRDISIPRDVQIISIKV